ncbi:MAG: LCP family protein [Ruminococcus flavefaciens]|nr:LCP family protein [Ruminococcus flavefaciens]
MTERFQNDNNTDNQNTLNIPIPENIPDYRRQNPNRRPLRRTSSQSGNYGTANNRNNNYQRPQNTSYRNNSNPYSYPNRPQQNSYQGDYYNQGYQNNRQYSNNYQYHQQPPPPDYNNYRNNSYQNGNYPARQTSPPRRTKKRKHRSPFGRLIKKVILSLFTILVLLFCIYSCTAFTIIGKVGKNETGDRNRTSGTLSRSYVKSVLVIGSDGRSAEEQGRSDSMILLSFNSRTQEIILTSFMRDCYVNIPGYGMDKLNASYSYGGAELLMDTIESNFMVKIDDYVIVNFISFAGIIDAVGGIDIDVSDEEAHAINDILFSEVNQLMGDDQWADFLENGGKLHLNGKQALSYARIRYVGNSDFERTSRQREVITKLIPKAINPVAISRIAKNVIPQVSTNMSAIDMYLLSLRLPLSVRYNVKQIQIPAENTFYPEDVWTASGDIQNVLQVDLNANYNILADEIFDH